MFCATGLVSTEPNALEIKTIVPTGIRRQADLATRLGSAGDSAARMAHGDGGEGVRSGT